MLKTSWRSHFRGRSFFRADSRHEPYSGVVRSAAASWAIVRLDAPCCVPARYCRRIDRIRSEIAQRNACGSGGEPQQLKTTVNPPQHESGKGSGVVVGLISWLA